MGRKGRGFEHLKNRSFSCTEEKDDLSAKRRGMLAGSLILDFDWYHLLFSQEEVMNSPASNHQGVSEMFYPRV